MFEPKAKQRAISTHALREEGDRPPKTAKPKLCISTHALREEGDHIGLCRDRRDVPFLPTPSARRATGGLEFAKLRKRYFYPRPPRGGRPASRRGGPKKHNFYPRPPRGGRRSCKYNQDGYCTFLPTPSARRATNIFVGIPPTSEISTHALREEGDGTRSSRKSLIRTFLPTPSARRATADGGERIKPLHDFYPRPPRGGRLGGEQMAFRAVVISTHALREEGDPMWCKPC